MNGSDVRKFIKQGEQATEVLEKLGYTYSAKAGEHPHWIAPVNPMDPILEALNKMIAEKVDADIKARIKDDPRGPNWHLVQPFEGKDFKVKPEAIPLNSQLRPFAFGPHFAGKLFRAIEIRYHRSTEYTGYAVLFHFNVRPYRPEVVWLPLSAVAFPN
uniref:Uncharacterized protein n=1 Tax=Pseudomonas phage Lepni01 TaxID=3138536 RepID=A0AAU6W3D7_9VIRU